MVNPPSFESRRPIARTELVHELRRLGVGRTSTVMVHASMSVLGWVVGGTGTLVLALQAVMGERGTVSSVLSWEDIPLHLDEWPDVWKRVYLEELPGFEPRTSAANPSYGRFPERLRTWPGARHSAHPDQRVAAVGPAAEWLTASHPLNDSFGVGTPFARLVEIEGDVLMLGAPLRSLTLLHHAEAQADVPDKRRWSYRLPFARDDDTTEWRELHDIDVERGPFPYHRVVPRGQHHLEVIARDALDAGVGESRRIGEAACYLFPAPLLVEFAISWLERRFGRNAARAEYEHAASSLATTDRL